VSWVSIFTPSLSLSLIITKDLTTYKIASLEPRLQLTEEVVGDGGLCGSTMLNMRFKQFLEKKLGNGISREDMNEVCGSSRPSSPDTMVLPEGF